MLQRVYSLLIRLHPTPFAQRYGPEMRAIFDESAGLGSELRLMIDAGASVLRQWVLRPEFRRSSSDEPVAVTTVGVPLFATLDSKRISPSAVLIGGCLSVALLSVIGVGGSRAPGGDSWFAGTHRQAGSVVPVTRSSLKEAEPPTLIKVGERAADPLLATAAGYFNVMPVLRAIDRDGDFVLSSWEIATAQSALLRLDKNHDGALSAEECGFSLGEESGTGVQQEHRELLVKEAKKAFMRTHPVLSVLDADHDGTISAEEMRNRSRSLLSLDKNRDGLLSPNEVLPTAPAIQAASIFLGLDRDFDGRISPAEQQRAGLESLRELMRRADKNQDGSVTPAELTKELEIREEAFRQAQLALSKVAPSKR